MHFKTLQFSIARERSKEETSVLSLFSFLDSAQGEKWLRLHHHSFYTLKLSLNLNLNLISENSEAGI